MGQNLPSIEYSQIEGKSIIDSPNSMYMIEFEKGDEFFSNMDSKVKFIKDCERLVRDNDRYNRYIAILKKEVSLDHCQVLSSLTDKDCTIEMHHGPIFTLFDICEIVINNLLLKNRKLTTFRVADIVLREHEAHRVQVVMLSTTIHQEIHDRELFVNMKQAWGNLYEFLKRYRLTPDLKEKYNRYVDQSMMMDSTTYDLLKKNEKLFAKGGIQE